MTLEDLRKEIDKLDDEMIALLEKRVQVVKQIGKLKVKLNQEVYNPKREEEILRRLQSLSSLPPHQIKMFYQNIFTLTKVLQEEKL
ncbi:chorismate mutase [Helicobacter cholecystus]|uniref:chorismate mutase n=2 Tax=Helicobacter cholecystus TaxID=45498 RepID=A0A3D8IU70_9HELI|nr:chorismate mutase [Helicobacter cholecystus]RDU68828.1 chorismate mutase [Helicobacter cholecystus]VEJ23894.1 chorismate mutase [Helicobacter cholecystus]